jgi:hypothetical protein
MHLIIVIPLRSLRTTPTIQRRNKRTNINNHNLSRWTLLLLLRSLTLVPFFVCCYYSSGRKEGRKTGQQQVVNVHFVLLETFGWKKTTTTTKKKKSKMIFYIFFFGWCGCGFKETKVVHELSDEMRAPGIFSLLTHVDALELDLLVSIYYYYLYFISLYVFLIHFYKFQNI